MRKRWPIQVLMVLLCMTMLCAVPAHAAQYRASERINLASATLSKKSNGDFSIYFSVRATHVMEKIGASSVEIQRNTSAGWVTEYTFTPSNSTIQAESKTRHSATLTYSPLFTGKEYRAVVMIYVEDDTGSSSKQLTTESEVH